MVVLCEKGPKRTTPEFILTCLNFSHLQSTLHLVQYTYQDIFSTAQSTFWMHQFWCLFGLLPFFVSPLPPLPQQQNVSLWGLFSSGETKNISQGEIRWIGRVGHGGMPFWVKNCWTLDGQMHWKSLPKKFSEAECSLSQQHQLVHWYRWVFRTLT